MQRHNRRPCVGLARTSLPGTCLSGLAVAIKGESGPWLVTESLQAPEVARRRRLLNQVDPVRRASATVRPQAARPARGVVTVAPVGHTEPAGPSVDENDAVARLLRLVDAQSTDADVMMWLATSFRRWLASGGSLTLPACLGLSSKVRLVLRRARNLWLCDAAALIEGGSWTKSKELRRAVLRFACGAWTRWRALEHPPVDATPMDARLFLAFRVGVDMPQSEQAYRNILKQSESLRKLG